jgi:hypothetical protein
VPSPRPTAPPPTAPTGAHTAAAEPIPSQRRVLAVRRLTDCEPPPDEMVQDISGTDRPAQEHRMRPRPRSRPAGHGGKVAADPTAPEFRAFAQDLARRLVTSLVEVLDGRRPVAQLRGRLAEPAFAALQTRVRNGRPSRPGRVQRVHTCHPAAGIVEVTATYGNGHRTRALALRLEHRAGRWRCTALRVL